VKGDFQGAGRLPVWLQPDFSIRRASFRRSGCEIAQEFDEWSEARLVATRLLLNDAPTSQSQNEFHEGVRMRCRRSHERFDVDVPLEATVQVLTDIVLCPGGDGGQVISQVPALTDDVLTLGMIGPEQDTTQVVRVLESRPVMVRGELRHELQLQPEPAAPAALPAANQAVKP
jgi:hypothetical protein